MSDLHIVVCMKVVPKSEEIRVDPETWRLLREGARSEINPPDMNALEMALQVKDRHGGHISIFSMGPPDFEPYMRMGLAMGADEIFLLSDRAFAGADTLATTYTLARGIEKLPSADLIICGEESADGATGQVPPGLAEWLEIPQITLVSELEVDPERRLARGRREIGNGYEVIETPLPTVISVKTASNEPRFMDYEIKDWAFEEAELNVWNAETLATDQEMIGVPGSPTIICGLEQAASRERKREFISGSQDEIVSRLTDILKAFR